MNIWPFNRPPREVRLSRLRRDVSRLDVELVDLREDFEKLMAAVKRIQGKSYRRKRADMEEVAAAGPPEGGEPPDGGDVNSDGKVQLHSVPFPRDAKQALRQRAAQLRGR